MTSRRFALLLIAIASLPCLPASAADSRWQAIGRSCDAESQRPAALIGEKIAQAAVDEYFLFGGHELDGEGHIVHFGLVETEHDAPKKLGEMGWWQVLKYWRNLDPSPERNLALAVYENASQNTHAAGAAKQIRDDPYLLAPEVLRRINTIKQLKDDSKVAVMLQRYLVKKEGNEIERELNFESGMETLREVAYRAAISDTPWSAAFISYVVKKGTSQAKQADRRFAASSSHRVYLYKSLSTAIADSLGQSPERNPIYRFCPPSQAKLRHGDLVCYHREPKWKNAKSGDIRDFMLEDIDKKRRQPDLRDEHVQRLKISHCDVVVEVRSDIKTAYVIGGNVLQSVAVKQLGLDPEAGTLLEDQPCPADAMRFSRKPSTDVDENPIIRGRRCSLNKSGWFAVLQLRS